jgi:uncharacterized protein (DUF1684 family)
MLEQVQAMRQQKDQFFKLHPQSPLTAEQRELFERLEYFPPNPELALELMPQQYEDKRQVKMMTTTGQTRFYTRWGYVEFTVDGQPARLTLYYTPGQDAFFLPFTDATTGTESYEAGRYMEVEQRPDGSVLLDFNTAYSPYCAYNEPPELAERAGREPRIWNCPIPPQENRLQVAIRAGEKKPSGAWALHIE